jgi:hypothetical protein
MGTIVFAKERAMSEHIMTDDLKQSAETRTRVAFYADCWEEYQRVLSYIRRSGKQHPPTARLIMLAMIGHEADANQISFDTGACSYSINENLTELTRQGILTRETFQVGRFKCSRYRINQGLLNARMGFNWIAGPDIGLSVGDSAHVEDTKE